MTGRYDPAPIRLEPHPADDRLAPPRLDRPPMNAFDQRRPSSAIERVRSVVIDLTDQSVVI